MGSGTKKAGGSDDSATVDDSGQADAKDDVTDTGTDPRTSTDATTETEIRTDEGGDDASTEGVPDFPPDELPRFTTTGTCTAARAAMQKFLLTFAPGKGLNDLPNNGQTDQPVDVAHDTVVYLTAPSIHSATGTEGMLDVKVTGDTEFTSILLRADTVHSAKGTTTQVSAKEIGEIQGTYILAEAAKIAKISPSTVVCVFADELTEGGNWTKFEMAPKTAGTTAKIKRLDLRATNQTILNHVHVETIVVCPGVTEPRVSLNDSTYDTLSPEADGSCT